MGTRGAVGFRVGGIDKVSYNHFDSYPDGLGLDVLDFIAHSNMKELKKIASSLVLINSDVPPTPEQIKELAPWTDLSVSEQSTSDWYCLTRGAQGDLNAYKEGFRYVSDASDFLLDSLFCEYAYIINVDTENLEFYKGFNKNKKAKGRYASVASTTGDEDGYCGVRLVFEIPLQDLFGLDAATQTKIANGMERSRLPKLKEVA